MRTLDEPVEGTVGPRDHAVVIYDDEDDLGRQLVAYLEEGLASRETTTFVDSIPAAEEAARFLARVRPDHRGLQERGDLVRSHYRDAFERGGRIDYPHVETVVGGLLDAARGRSRRGLRIFVDASRSYFAEGRAAEWFAFEAWLGPRLHAEAGLVCAYRREDVRDPFVAQQVAGTHGFRYDGAAKRG